MKLSLDPNELRPLIAEVVAEVLQAVRQSEERLAYREAEAASLLGLNHHQLRDLRLRGEIEASRGPGGRILYRREDIEKYLLRNRYSPS